MSMFSARLSLVAAATADRKTRIPHDERHAQCLLVRIPLVGEPAVAMEIAVVADEHNQRVVVDALRLQFVDEPAHRRIDLGDEAVVANHVVLVTLRRIEPPLEADPPLIRVGGKKRRQRVQELRAAER